MTAPSSAPRGERAPRPGATWNTVLAAVETVVPDGTPDTALPRPNRATRRALARATRKENRRA